MRIYDKKKFIFGVMYFLLGICMLTLGFLKGFDVKGVILSILTPLIGISEVYLSTNRKAVKQEKFEKADERNQLIELTSASKAFHITREVGFVSMIICLGIGTKLNHEVLTGIGIGFAFLFSTMVFLDLFLTVYYEDHM